MSDEARPNPDALLSSIQREEAARKRGRLKVFLGMCPGVGKTFAMLEAAQRRMVLLIDGFIVTSALLVAARLQPSILDYCIFSHCSDEAGHRQLLDNLGGRALLDLHLRLGEGTGCALAMPLLFASVNFVREMATFESASVSTKSS